MCKCECSYDHDKLVSVLEENNRVLEKANRILDGSQAKLAAQYEAMVKEMLDTMAEQQKIIEQLIGKLKLKKKGD